MATGTIILPVQSAKITGSFVTDGDPAQGARIDAGDGVWKLLFDANTAEAAIWQFRMPVNFASALTAKILNSMASATSGTVAYDISIMANADGENINTVSFDTVNSTTAITVPGTAGFQDSISTALTSNDSVAAGEMCIVKLARDVALDSATGDAEVFAFSLEYTTT